MTGLARQIERLTGKCFFIFVMIIGTVIILMGAVKEAFAQVDCSSQSCNGADYIIWLNSGQPHTTTYSSGNYDPVTIKKSNPDIDTNVNRQIANSIYEVAFAEINKILTTKGKAAALELSQHPERISGLTAIVKNVHEDQYMITERVIAEAMSDAKQYINVGHIVNVHAMSDARWKGVASDVQKDVDAKDANTSEIQFLKNCYESPNCFGPLNEKAAGFVISIYEKQQEEQQAAEAAAEAARQEQARIAQQKAAEDAQRAAEQARIAQQEATDRRNAAIAAMQKRRSDAISASMGQGGSSVNESQLSSLLVGKTVIPMIELGDTGNLGNSIVINGRPKMFQLKTLVYPDGRVILSS